MDTPQQTNPEENKKRPAAVKILYGATMTVLVCLLLVSAYLFLTEKQPEQSGQLQSSQTALQESTAASEPTAPSSTATEPSKPADPTEPTEATNPAEPTQPTGPAEPDKVDIRLNTHDMPVYLTGKGMRDYLAAENVASVKEFLRPYRPSEGRMDLGVPVELSYKVYSLPKGVTVKKAVFRLYGIAGSADYLELQPETGSCSVSVYNLLTGRYYPYQALITLSDGTEMALSGSFRTAAGPRLINLEGAVNVRDVGGWVTEDGKTVKQGLLYRGSEIDGAEKPEFKLTEKGLKQLQALGIRRDMDLRATGLDVLGPEVKHTSYGVLQYELAFTPAGQDAIRRVFADLADPDNYPCYMHCTYGADRTGTISYLLLGLLGVSDADLIREYELTALYYGYAATELLDVFVQQIAECPGENTTQRVEYFLLNAGVTAQQIERIRQIFLG